MPIMIDMFGLFLRLIAFVLLMKINKGLFLLKKNYNQEIVPHKGEKHERVKYGE